MHFDYIISFFKQNVNLFDIDKDHLSLFLVLI